MIDLRETPEKKIASFETTDGERSVVYQYGSTYVVRFWNKDGVWMDASDYRTTDLADAMNAAGEEHPDVIRID